MNHKKRSARYPSGYYKRYIKVRHLWIFGKKVANMTFIV